MKRTGSSLAVSVLLVILGCGGDEPGYGDSGRGLSGSAAGRGTASGGNDGCDELGDAPAGGRRGP